MSRSGKLIAHNDELIEQLILDDDYRISENGEIYTLIARTGKRSLSNKWRKAGTIKRKGKTEYKYIRYLGKKLAIHRIIYRKFNGKLEADLVINHIDGNGINNNPDNLELVTQSKNNKHSFRNRKGVKGNCRFTPDDIKNIRYKRQVEKLTLKQIANLYKTSKGAISEIVNYKTWKDV